VRYCAEIPNLFVPHYIQQILKKVSGMGEYFRSVVGEHDVEPETGKMLLDLPHFEASIILPSCRIFYRQ
jgi:hypothetical protein